MRAGISGPAGGRCGWWFWLAGLVLVVAPFGSWGASEGGPSAVDVARGAGAPPWQVLFGLVLGEASEEAVKARIPRLRRTGTDPYTEEPVYEAAGEDLPEPGFSRAEFIFGAGRLVAVRLYYRTGVFGRRFREIVQRLLKQGYEQVCIWDMPGARNAYVRSREQVRRRLFDDAYPVAKAAVYVSEGLSFEGKVFYETHAYVLAVQKFLKNEQQRAMGGEAGVPPGQVLFGLVLGKSSEAELEARIPGARRTGTDRFTEGPVYEAAGEDLPEPGFSRAEFVFGEGRLVAVRLYFRTGVSGRRFREIVWRLARLYELQHLHDRIIAGRSAHLESREKVWIDVFDESEFVPKVRVGVYESYLSFEGEISYVTYAYTKAVREFGTLAQQRAFERVMREASKVKPSSPR